MSARSADGLGPGALVWAGFDGPQTPPQLLDAVRGGRIGGILLFALRGNVRSKEQVRAMLREVQEAARAGGQPAVPVAVDQEGGSVVRVGYRAVFPSAMALGAIADTALVEQVARAVSLGLRADGISVNHAPVCDVNVEPRNPVINTRSFGDDPALVAGLSAAWVRGSEGAGVATTPKHFPGHGASDVDSHHTTVDVRADRSLLERRELVPFRAAIAAGASGLMTAHIRYPALDEDSIATLSPAIATRLLRQELGFDGLLMTDSLDMSGVTQVETPDGLVGRAVRAGINAVMVTSDIQLQLAASERIALQVPAPRILEALRRAAVFRRKFGIDVPDEDFEDGAFRALAREVAARSITHLGPALPRLDRIRVTFVGSPRLSPVEELRDPFGTLEAELRRRFKDRVTFAADGHVPPGDAPLVVCSSSASFDQDQGARVRELATRAAVLCALRSPYDATLAPHLPVLLTYGDVPVSLEALATVLAGERAAEGTPARPARVKRRSLLGAAAAVACTTALPDRSPTPTATARAAALMAGMSVPDRVAQLMSVAFHGPAITPHLERMIRERHIGGVVIFRENIEDAAALRRLTADLQRIARDARIPPLFIAMDQEGGPVVRLSRGVALPPAQMAQAAAPDPQAAVRRSALLVARELRTLGVNWQLAPVADVNDEPQNPIIGNRSFGSDPRTVGALVAAAVRAYAEAGLLCCAKHFPGHGSATSDSHSDLPAILSPRSRLDSVELAPFRAAIGAEVPAIMSAHLLVPALGAAQQPATLSRSVMTDLLRGELGFKGLCVTDDLEMGALSRSGGQAQAALAAVQAGVDYLLFRFDESAQIEGHRRLVDAVASGALAVGRLDEAVTRVLEAKARWSVLEAPAAGAYDLEADRAEALDLARQGITVLRAGGLPLRGEVLAISYGQPDIAIAPDQPALADVVARAVPGARARKLEQLTRAEIAGAVSAARGVDVVVVGTFDALGDPAQAELVTALQRQRPTVAVALRSPYDILAYPTVSGFVCAYSGREPALIAALDVMTGARPPQGLLPVDVPGLYRIGAGMRSL